MTDRHRNAPRRVALASGSPRRRELLCTLGLDVIRVGAGVDETRAADEPLHDYVSRLAVEKALSGQRDPRAAGLPVVAGDTVVALGERDFGKPTDRTDAHRILGALSAREHSVHTSVAVVAPDSAPAVKVVTSTVTMRAISAAEIDAYWDTGEPADKAGAYAIQGVGGVFVAHLRGSYSAVMGLPVFEVAAMLGETGCAVLAVREAGAA